MADFTYEVGGWGLRIRFGSDAYASYNIYSPHTLYNSPIFYTTPPFFRAYDLVLLRWLCYEVISKSLSSNELNRFI